MLNQLRGHSVLGVAFLLSVFFLGLLFRFSGITLFDAWTDELATVFYSNHLSLVYLQESHAPFYYGILSLIFGGEVSLIQTRLFSACVSSFYLGVFFYLGKSLFNSRNAFYLFWTLVCLWPIDIIFARQARHYAWMGESILLYFMMIHAQCKLKWKIPAAILPGLLHPFSGLAAFILSFFNHEKKDKWILATSSCVFFLYYLYRVLDLGSSQVGLNLAWNHSSFPFFIKALALMFIGDSFPHNYFFGPKFSYWPYVYSGLALMILLSRSRYWFQWFILLAGSILATEILTRYWVNFRLARYLIYLPMLVPFIFAKSLKRVGYPLIVTSFVLLSYYLVSHQFSTPYPWDDSTVKLFRSIKTQHNINQEIICMYQQQASFYGFKEDKLCHDMAAASSFDKKLILLDLNNNANDLVLALMDMMKIEHIYENRHSKILIFTPRTK